MNTRPARPDARLPGCDHLLRKLGGFGGIYINAEMVKAFIDPVEYKARFGP